MPQKKAMRDLCWVRCGCTINRCFANGAQSGIAMGVVRLQGVVSILFASARCGGDWLVEVHLKFKLVPETLYLTVNIIDRYLAKTEVSRPKLQLVGVTALLIASKYEEIYPPELRDLVYICDRAYSKLEVRAHLLALDSPLAFTC